MQKSRIPTLSEISFLGAGAWFDAMHACGLLFHPDDDPGEIVDISTNELAFSENEIEELRTVLRTMFDQLGDSVYEAAAPVFEKTMKNMIGDAEMSIETNKKSDDFDLDNYCRNVALGEFLSGDDFNHVHYDEILASLRGEDDGALLEEFGIYPAEEFELDSHEEIANKIEKYCSSIKGSIEYANSMLNAANLKFTRSVRSLCAAIEEGDPQTIANQQASVKKSLPPLGRTDYVSQMADLALDHGVSYDQHEKVGDELFRGMVRGHQAINLESDNDRRKCKLPVPVRKSPEEELISWLNDQVEARRDSAIKRHVAAYVPLYCAESETPKFAVISFDNTRTAAFDDIGRNDEVGRVLVSAAEKIMGDWKGGDFDLVDTNSNVVGRFTLVEALPEASAVGDHVRLHVDLTHPLFRKEMRAELAWHLKEMGAEVAGVEGDVTIERPYGKLVIASDPLGLESAAHAVENDSPALR